VAESLCVGFPACLLQLGIDQLARGSLIQIEVLRVPSLLRTLDEDPGLLRAGSLSLLLQGLHPSCPFLLRACPELFTLLRKIQGCLQILIGLGTGQLGSLASISFRLRSPLQLLHGPKSLLHFSSESTQLGPELSILLSRIGRRNKRAISQVRLLAHGAMEPDRQRASHPQLVQRLTTRPPTIMSCLVALLPNVMEQTHHLARQHSPITHPTQQVHLRLKRTLVDPHMRCRLLSQQLPELPQPHQSRNRILEDMPLSRRGRLQKPNILPYQEPEVR